MSRKKLSPWFADVDIKLTSLRMILQDVDRDEQTPVQCTYIRILIEALVEKINQKLSEVSHA